MSKTTKYKLEKKALSGIQNESSLGVKTRNETPQDRQGKTQQTHIFFNFADDLEAEGIEVAVVLQPGDYLLRRRALTAVVHGASTASEASQFAP